MRWKRNLALVINLNRLQEKQKRPARFNSISLNEEVMSILFVEDKAIVESRSIIVKTLNNVNSKLALSTRNLSTLKSKIVMTLPSAFDRLTL